MASKLIVWAAAAFSVGCGGTSEEMHGQMPQVAASPSGRSFPDQLTVALVSDQPGDIYFTVDGSSPNDPGAQLYITPIVLEADALLSFVAVSDIGRWSPPGSELYRRDLAPLTVDVPMRALEVSTDSLFLTGDVVGERVTETLELRSVGPQAIRIRSMQIVRGGGFYEEGRFSLPALSERLLHPGQTLTLPVSYVTTRTFRSATLLIETDGLKARDGRWEIALLGRAFL